VFNGYRDSVWGNGRNLEMDGGDGCTELWKYLMPWNYTLKMVNIRWALVAHACNPSYLGG
jgi:hypothetical protein